MADHSASDSNSNLGDEKNENIPGVFIGEERRSSLLNKKRENVLQWDDYFLAVAFLSSMRSKDPSTQVGACIVNQDNRIVGIGYNGFPRGCSDDELPWAKEGETELDTKYPVEFFTSPFIYLFYSFI